MGIPLGRPVTLATGQITNSFGPATPDTLVLTIIDPTATSTPYDITQFVVDGVGKLHFDYLPPSAGFYEWRMVTTDPNDAIEGSFTVDAPFAEVPGGTTLADLVNEIQGYLYGFGVERDKETSLTEDIDDPADIAFTVVDGAQVDRGVVEIDNEIIAVAVSDRGSGNITVHPWGRGWQGTSATTHTAGSRVVNNPRFPRSRIKATINEIINNIYPALFAVGVDTTNTVNPAVVTYPVNAAAESIVSISIQTLGPTKMWRPVQRRSFDYVADPASFTTGKSVDLIERGAPGRPIKIVYRSRFQPLINDTDTLADSGLDEGYRDIITMGVEARLLPALDGPRLQLGTVESKTMAQYDQPGIASQVAKQLYNQYQQRVQDERDRLLRQYPGSIVRMS